MTRRLSTIAGFYRTPSRRNYSIILRRRMSAVRGSTTVACRRAGPQRARCAAGRRRARPAAEHALISLLALNGLRVSEATGADIEHLGLERGHRTLTVTREGGKVVTVPLAPRTARAIDLAIGERPTGRCSWPRRRRLDQHGAGRIVRKVARRAGIAKAVTPHTLRHAFITAALDAGVPLRDVQEAASHAIREPRCGMTGPAAAWTGTRPTSSPPTSRRRPVAAQVAAAPPGSRRQAELAHRLLPTAEADGRAAVTNAIQW